MSGVDIDRRQWEKAIAGAFAGFATVAALHPLDVVRTRFQVNNGHVTGLPSYKNTGHAIFTIARTEGLRGLYAGFYPAVLGSTMSWALYFFFYGRAKHRYSKGSDEKLSPGYHLIAAAEAGALVCLFTNPIWLVKTRLQLQTPLHHKKPYFGFSDALRTILKEEGWRALYKGIGPSLLLVSHGAIQFTAYEELRKVVARYKSNKGKADHTDEDKILKSIDYAVLGASSKFAAILLTYPYQVIRARVQQRPSSNGVPRYKDSWHVVKETIRFEGIRGFYRGITPNLLKNLPAASITFVVYENTLKLFSLTRRNNKNKHQKLKLRSMRCLSKWERHCFSPIVPGIPHGHCRSTPSSVLRWRTRWRYVLRRHEREQWKQHMQVEHVVHGRPRGRPLG